MRRYSVMANQAVERDASPTKGVVVIYFGAMARALQCLMCKQICPNSPALIRVAAFLLTLIAGLPVALAGEDRTYDPVGHEVIATMHQILIDNGKCTNRNDCNVKQYVFFESSSSGLTFTVYGVTEKEIVASFVGALSAQAQKLPIETKLVAQFVRITKEADLRRGLFSSAPVFAEISVAGGYDRRR